MKRRLAIIDPALGAVQGHHAAFADMLRTADYSGFEISLWCSRQMNSEMRYTLQQAGIEVRPVLDIQWYSWFEKEPPVREHTQYLNQLVKSLSSVLVSISQQGPTTLLYHTVDWIHAMALNITLEYLGEKAALLKHYLLLMFDPGSDKDKEQQRKQMHYSLGFRALLRRPNVRVFASCDEYVPGYQKLLPDTLLAPVRNGIAIHPCFLADWARWSGRNTKVSSANVSDPKSFVLFMGDPREDKGFLRLPELIEKLLSNQESAAKILVQHNVIPQWADKRFHENVDKLIELAEQNASIELHQQYWSDKELWEAIESSDAIIFNYDEEKFQTKTSGVLWLAAWHQKIIVAPPTTWLWREAKRLGCRVVELKDLSNISLSIASESNVTECEIYRKKIFSPFFNWLVAVAEDIDPETLCVSNHMDTVYDYK